MAIGNNGYTPRRSLTEADVVDNLMSSAGDLPLSARQGSVLDGKVGQLCNPNLLINPNLADPINQRGQKEYTAAKYTIDRWRLANNDSVGKVVVGENGITFTKLSPTENAYLVQDIENSSALKGKEVTVSAKINGNIITATGVIENRTNASYAISKGRTIRIYNSSRTGCLEFTIDLNTLTSGESLNIEWAKLELGSVATPFVPPDPATELLKCQRYYVNLNILKHDFCVFGFSLGNGKSVSNAIVYLPVPLRVAPRIICNGNIVLMDDNFRIKVTNLYVDQTCTTNIKITVNTESNTDDTKTYLLCANNDNTANICFDAEIY